MKHWLTRALFALYLLILLEFLGQVTMRIATGGWPLADRGGLNAEIFERHPYLVGVPRPGAAVERNGAWARINASGYRGAPVAEPSDSVLRVLALGGSTTFGVGLDDADTWPVRLQVALDSALAAAPGRFRRSEVINGGVPGYTSAENLIQLELLGVYLKPDVVVLFQGLNDIRNGHSPGLRTDYANFHAVSQEGNLAVDRLRWGNRSGLVRLGRGVLTRLFALPTPHVVPAERRGDPDPQAEAIFYSNLMSFAAVCRVHGVPCLFVPQVVSVDFPVDQWWMLYLIPDSLPATMARYNNVMRSAAEATGMVFATGITEFAWTKDDFRDYCHFSALGDRRFASLLVPQVLAGAGQPR